MSKKTALIEATKSLLWEKGYEATSPRDIQSRSETGQGSFYHHFAGKKDLAVAALESVSEEMVALFQARLTADSPALARLADYLSKPRNGLKGCRIGRLANEATVMDTDLNRPIQGYFEKLEALLEAVILEGQEKGTVTKRSPAKDIAVLMVAAVQGGFILARIHGRADLHQDIARSLIPLLEE